LSLLLQTLLFHLSLFRSSTYLSTHVKDEFLTAQITTSGYNQLSGVFQTFDTFEMQKKTSIIYHQKQKIIYSVH